MEKLYTVEEAALASGYNVVHLRRLCHDKKVSHTRRGKRYFFTPEEAAHLIVHIVPENKLDTDIKE